MNPPHEHPRRILVAVTGLSPQVVTETLYALAVKAKPTFVPTEIRLVTTQEGADRAELLLLHPESGWFHRLRADYGLPPIAFGRSPKMPTARCMSPSLVDARPWGSI